LRKNQDFIPNPKIFKEPTFQKLSNSPHHCHLSSAVNPLALSSLQHCHLSSIVISPALS
jgi:hypothetical protein